MGIHIIGMAVIIRSCSCELKRQERAAQSPPTAKHYKDEVPTDYIT